MWLRHCQAIATTGSRSATSSNGIEKLTATELAYVDESYRSHKTENLRRVFISGHKRDKRELKRRSAIEPVIGLSQGREDDVASVEPAAHVRNWTEQPLQRQRFSSPS